MKITGKSFVSNHVEQLWQQTAAEIGLETGLYIEVKTEYLSQQSVSVNGSTPIYNFPIISRIYFDFNGHQFDSLPELKRALSLMAFL